MSKKRLKIKRMAPTICLETLGDAFADAVPELMVLVLVDIDIKLNHTQPLLFPAHPSDQFRPVEKNDRRFFFLLLMHAQ